jgi:hypothetical protein
VEIKTLDYADLKRSNKGTMKYSAGSERFLNRGNNISEEFR